MDKVEYITYWIKMSHRDWETMETLFGGGRYLHCLFFLHLSMEKLLKAAWVKDNREDTPPLIHNLIHIYDQTDLNLSSEETDILQNLNQYNIAGRYQDYKDKVYQRATKAYTTEKIQQCTHLRATLLQKLQ